MFAFDNGRGNLSKCEGESSATISQISVQLNVAPAMGFYACGTIPLIDSGNIERKVTQIWYADDSAAGGKLEEMRKWWDNLCIKGPLFGYNPKSSKTWVIVKPEHEEKARNLFPDVNVTSIGRRYLGSFIGTDQGKK